jgi:PilZ domain-containing protein
MRRLAVTQPVVLDLEEEAIECVVEAIAGEETTIAPLAAADAGYIPSLGRSAALVFAGGAGARTRVRGAVHRGSGGGRLRFVAGRGGSDLPARRQAARAGVALEAELEPVGAGEPARRLATSDVSIGGIGVRVGDWAPAEGALLRFALALPAAPPIRGTARVLRVAGGVAGLEIAEIAPADRARLAAFLIASRAA